MFEMMILESRAICLVLFCSSLYKMTCLFVTETLFATAFKLQMQEIEINPVKSHVGNLSIISIQNTAITFTLSNNIIVNVLSCTRRLFIKGNVRLSTTTD